ncbi:50S ribosomal protein L29 [Candidatus Desantisbacteria bacterium]|nr:50S ribosomal protein L29 [Candidatus Desantisbacteria bacterium]
MKPNKIQALRDMSFEELSKELESTRAKLFGLKCQQLVGGGTSNTHNIKDLRRKIARIFTVLTENKLKNKKSA